MPSSPESLVKCKALLTQGVGPSFPLPDPGWKSPPPAMDAVTAGKRLTEANAKSLKERSAHTSADSPPMSMDIGVMSIRNGL